MTAPCLGGSAQKRHDKLWNRLGCSGQLYSAKSNSELCFETI